MRVIASIFLILLFVPLFLIAILATTVRFQILDSNFWLGTFSQNNIYENLSTAIKKYAEDKTVASGGNKNDIRVLTDLITPANVQDGVTRNLTNVLNFVNGQTGMLDIYIPFDKIPKDLLPTTYDEKSNTIPLTSLLVSLNIQGIGKPQLNIISSIGFWSWTLLVMDLILVFVALTLQFLLTRPGRRFWNIAVGLLLSGLITIFTFIIGEGIRRSVITEWPKNTEPAMQIFAVFSPYILQRILVLWLVIGVCAIAFGILLFFFKRPVYNKR